MENNVLSHDAQLTPEEYGRLPRHQIYIGLDNLRSAFNVGSIFRTADTARIKKLLLCGYTAYPPHAKLEKTAMGTLSYVTWQHYTRTVEAIKEMRKSGIPVIGLETVKKRKSVFDYKLPPEVCLFFGNEALGLSSETLRNVDDVVEIPVFGFKNSMNVASACSVAVFETIRQNRGVIQPVNIYRKEENVNSKMQILNSRI